LTVAIATISSFGFHRCQARSSETLANIDALQREAFEHGLFLPRRARANLFGISRPGKFKIFVPNGPGACPGGHPSPFLGLASAGP